MFRRAFGIGDQPIGPRKVVVRARFPHRYDGMGTRIRTDDTLGTSAWMWDINVSDDVTDIGIVVVGRGLREAAPPVQDAGRSCSCTRCGSTATSPGWCRW